MARMPKRNSKGRFVKSGGRSRGRKRSGKSRRKTSRRRGTVAGALAMIGL